MQQDRALKAGALTYVLSKRWLPQLELDVSTIVATSRKPASISDVDVLAAVPDDFVGFRTVLIDCKTRKGESPINRALWLRGLMERIGAERGICILRLARIEPDHRYTAAQLGVTLLAERELPAFASATSAERGTPPSALADRDRWDQFFSIGSRYAGLERAVSFSRTGYWMSENEAEACIRTVFLAAALRGELDPGRPEHLAVVADLVALLLHALARIVAKVFAAYLQPGSRDDLSRALLFLLYGGRASYMRLSRIKHAIARPREVVHRRRDDTPELELPVAPLADQVRDGPKEAASTQGVPELSLPEWGRFVELVRQMLDAPVEVSRGPLLVREVAWAALGCGVSPSDGVSDYAKVLGQASPQGSRLAVLGLDYLCKAAKLPREFGEVLSSRLLKAQSRT